MTLTHYAIRKISDPRSRGVCYWFEIEGCDAAGNRWHVGTYDTRDEAREALEQIKAAPAGAA
jgi:hypothetical protein